MSVSVSPSASPPEIGEDEEVVFVDVRTPAEYAAGHVEGAVHIPHTEMDRRYGELTEYADDEIVVYCRSGRRSGIVKTYCGGIATSSRKRVPP